MKTDRFDEEFRRKLLNLPVDADPGEAERVHNYVQANRPALPGAGWGKLLFYGVSGLLLLGSFSYNLLQNYRNTRLQSSLDSLTSQSISNGQIRHDTVYITQSGPAESLKLAKAARELNNPEPLKQGETNQPEGVKETGSTALHRVAELQSVPNRTASNEVAKTNPSTANSKQNQPLRQVEAETVDSVSTPIASERSAFEKTETLEKSVATGKVRGMADASTTSPLAGTRSRNVQPTSRPSTGFEKDGPVSTSYSPKQRLPTTSEKISTGFSQANSDLTNSGNSIAEANHQWTAIDQLNSRQFSTTVNQLAMISPSRPLLLPKLVVPVWPIRHTSSLTSPNRSVTNVQYRVGGGFTVGHDQLSGSLLGEVALTQHWSVQTGLQVGYELGFHYRDEDEYNEHKHEDFRQTYASQVPSSSDIQDIKQLSLLVQVPIQVAYHLPVGRQWGLRLGVGTNLDIAVQRGVSYTYRENARSSERALTRVQDPVSVLNNFLLSTSVERPWKNWLFRAGPFINPQLRPVTYRPDDLSWGANLQVFYRFGK